jgi:hypothetical protein
MSHNTTKVNSQEPSAAGVVSQALNDLSDVSASSPSADQVLIYSGGTWGAGNGGASGGVINIGQGESDAYSNSGATTITATDDVFFTTPQRPTGSAVAQSTMWPPQAG